ncbi:MULTISPECIES: anti-sigma factor domain-containing protein [unclassified Blastococcus]
MPKHCTPEDLALAALGEPLPAEDAAHLAGCPACTDEVAGLRRGVEALAIPEFAAPGAAVAPPPHVWTAIAAATGVRAAPPAAAPSPPAVPAAAAPADDAPAPAAAEVVPLRRGRSRLLLAAAASLVVGAGIGAGAVALGGDDDEDDAVVALAAADLDPLDGSDSSGQAEVVERPDGTRVLRLELDVGAVPEDGYYELWLIDEAVQGMVPVGVVDAGTEELELPADLDLDEFPIVDVSIEPLDGDPTHSGVSIVRGQLEV